MGKVLEWLGNHKALIASVGMALTLASQEKYAEAAAVLFAALSGGIKPMLPVVTK